MAIPPSNPPAAAPGGAGAPADPSMEDILASIRRILNEDETAPAAGTAVAEEAASPHAGEPEPEGEDDVLELDQSMMVAAPLAEPDPAPVIEDPYPPFSPVAVPPAVLPPPIPMPPPVVEPLFEPIAAPPPVPPPAFAAGGSELLAPESEAATLSAMGSLVRTLSAERQTQVHRGGPTIEDLVREEIRPLLKGWLDQHLPPMVERLVRSEIERLMGRVAP